jgi:hypothetical protein
LDSVLRGETTVRGVGDRGHAQTEIDPIVLRRGEAVLRGDAGRVDDLVDVGGAVAVVVGIPPQDDALVDDSVGDVVRARAGRIVDSARVDRRVRQDGAEEEHRQPGRQVADGFRQAKLEPVGAEHAHSFDRPRLPLPNGVRSDDLVEKTRSGEAHSRIRDAVERVGEAASGHRSAGVEAKCPPELEPVRAGLRP